MTTPAPRSDTRTEDYWELRDEFVKARLDQEPPKLQTQRALIDYVHRHGEATATDVMMIMPDGMDHAAFDVDVLAPLIRAGVLGIDGDSAPSEGPWVPTDRWKLADDGSAAEWLAIMDDYLIACHEEAWSDFLRQQGFKSDHDIHRAAPMPPLEHHDAH